MSLERTDMLYDPLLGKPTHPLDVANLRCWVLDDGRQGHLNQSLGVAHALGFKDPHIQPIEPKGSKFKRTIMRVLGASQVAWHLPRGPYPDVLIATGWKASEVSRLIKQIHPKTFTVQMMDPSGDIRDYDVVAMPLHDDPPALDNVVSTIGAPNTVTPERLMQEADRWESRLLDCPSPRLAVMIGGSTKGFRFNEAAMQDFMAELLPFAKYHGYSLLVTTSRRTPMHLVESLRLQFQYSKLPHYFWTGLDPSKRDNPYLAYLALSEAVVVTADSVSMTSEACTAGKPVYVWGQGRFQRRKFQLYYDILIRQHRAAPFPPQKPLRAPDYPLADTERVAGFVKGRLARRG